MSGPMYRYQREVGSVFDLLGRNEVDLTAALGWALSKSPTLRAALWRHLDLPGNPRDIEIALETADDAGRTDLELRLDTDTGTVLVIVEAKKGWLQPGETQLTKYLGRFTGVTTPLLVSLSDSSAEWAARELRPVGDIPVRHLPWDDVRTNLARALNTTRSHTERTWLNELRTYLKGATAMRPYDSQWVYLVTVNNDMFGSMTFKDYVRSERVYFHPFGKKWPKRPPILMGFRWNGRLQQVNRVTSSTILPRLQERWPDIPEGPRPGESWGPHAVYDLGPDIPVPNIRTGNLYASARTWVLLDQLLTCETIAEAAKASRALQDDAAAH